MSLAAGRLPSTFLFVGPSGIGKRTFALTLAKALLCETHPEQALDPCGVCSACRQVEAGSHPDLHLLAKQPDRKAIELADLIGDREHRMREGLCRDIALKPIRGRRKIAVIDDADFLNTEGANALLKTLEEPPPRAVIVLVGTGAQRQLPTIRSRCQIVRFAPLEDDVVARLLLARGVVQEESEAVELARLCQGSQDRAEEWLDPELREYRPVLLRSLSEASFDKAALTRSLIDFVEAAGTEAPPRRERLRRVIGHACEFYRQLLRHLAGADVAGDDALLDAVNRVAGRWRGGNERAAACWERCHQALMHVEANAHHANITACWIDELPA